jgi:hypothetical protein
MNQLVSTAELTYFSNRSIAEVESLQEEVAAVIPAGNIVGLVLGGLTRLRSRTLPADQAKSDVSALLRGLDMLPHNIFPRTLYYGAFAGPAAVLAAYQKLLALAGKDSESAFPEGLWQFYLEFAMREDSARHANETIGFQTALSRYNLNLSASDQLAAWVCAASQIYFQYDELLANEWHERVYLHLLEQIVQEAGLEHKLYFQRLSQAWATQRPYKRGTDASHEESYSIYRRRRFDQFLASRLHHLPPEQQEKLQTNYADRLGKELAAYQRQMTILVTLEPDRYREERHPISLAEARVGVIFHGHYYILPACYTDQMGRPILFENQAADSSFQPLQHQPEHGWCGPDGQPIFIDRAGRVYDTGGSGQVRGYLRPAHFQAIRRQVTAILNNYSNIGYPPSVLDRELLGLKRTEQKRAYQAAPKAQQELTALKYTPVIINWDEQERTKPLAYIRQGKRGIGTHALTIFRTADSTVFDQSHIFFDGAWGMALSEIMTNEALSWAAYFSSLAAPDPAHHPPYRLSLESEPALTKFAPDTTREVSAESDQINVKALYTLCKLLPKRHPDLKLTINDMLILYRCEFGQQYTPSAKLEDALFELRAQDTPAVQEAYDLINNTLIKAQSNPSLVIPMDATAVNPRERLYPTIFRNPFNEIWSKYYQNATAALDQYLTSPSHIHWSTFANMRRSLLAQLNYFGQLMRAYKKVALEGGSTSAATIKLLAHLPDSLLKFLDDIPRRFDILNEVIKGEEVFSNVGRVARGSSLTRFLSAKDDNENKRLVWGILTDDTDQLYITLRDFRPHVAALHRLNRTDLAELIVTDYLEAYVTGLNQFTDRLLDILHASATHTPEKVK